MVLICLSVVPVGGWPAGQSRFAPERPAFFGHESPATASVATHAIGRSAKGGTLLVELRGSAARVFSREQIAFRVTATDEDGILIRFAVLEVDFGDGIVETFQLDHRTEITHAWNKRGRYKMEFRLTDQGDFGSRGKMRIRVGGPLRVFLQIMGEEEATIEEESRYRFVAFAREGRQVPGVLTIEWGDGTTTKVSHFDGDVMRAHTYLEEDAYVISATLTYADGTKEKARTFEVEASETGGAIDLRTAIVAINSNQGIADFKVTSTVTNVTISTSQICIYHTKAGGWPVKDGLEGNPWVAAFVGGKLNIGTYEWLRPGQICKGITKANIGPHVKHGALASWRPAKGETVYFFVSTLARLGATSSNERSDVYAFVWPY
jgi:hypothetical protein